MDSGNPKAVSGKAGWFQAGWRFQKRPGGFRLGVDLKLGRVMVQAKVHLV